MSRTGNLHESRANNTFVNQMPDCMDIGGVMFAQDYECRHMHL